MTTIVPFPRALRTGQDINLTKFRRHIDAFHRDLVEIGLEVTKVTETQMTTKMRPEHLVEFFRDHGFMGRAASNHWRVSNGSWLVYIQQHKKASTFITIKPTA